MRHLLTAIMFLICIPAISQTKQPVLVTDMLKIKTITSVTLAEDGSKAVFVVTSIEPESDVPNGNINILTSCGWFLQSRVQHRVN